MEDLNENTEAAEKTEETKAAEATEEMVPKARLEEVESKLKTAEEQGKLRDQQQALIAANQQSQQPAKVPFDIYKHVGLEDDDDIPNVAQKKAIDKYYQDQTNRAIFDLQFMATHPDYKDIVGSPETGQYAEPLKEAITKNPALIPLITQSRNVRAAAYEIAKLHVKKPEEKVETVDANKAIEEAAKFAKTVKSSSNAPGGDVLSEEGRVAGLTEEAFYAMAVKNGAVL